MLVQKTMILPSPLRNRSVQNGKHKWPEVLNTVMIIGLFSAKEIGEKKLEQIISKKLDSVNNMQIALTRSGDIIVYPLDYPNSISTFLRVLSISESVIFVLNQEVSALDAEIALTIEFSALQKGYVLTDDYSDTQSFDALFSKYKLGKLPKIRELAEIDRRSDSQSQAGASTVSIDKHFIVKGIGQVVLGFVLDGTVKKGDKMYLLPSGKQVIVKSIQVMDEDKNSCGKGEHVGLALNNVDDKDFDVNYSVSSSNEVKSEFACVFTKTDFYKLDPFASSVLTCAINGRNFGLNLKKENEKTLVSFSKPILKSQGSIVVADTSLAVGKNRIVGALSID